MNRSGWVRHDGDELGRFAGGSRAFGQTREERVDEFVGAEWSEILGLFADAQVLHGKSNLLADGDHHAALRGSVNLGQHNAGTFYRFGKLERLADAVLSGRGVEDQQYFVRGFGDLLADRVLDLGELGHEVLLRLQAAGGIDDGDVHAILDGIFDGTIGNARGVAVRLAGDDGDAEAVAPDRELLDGSGSKGIPCPKDDFFALRGQQSSELGDARGLAGAVDAADEDHGRAGGREADRRVVLFHQGAQLLLPCGEDLIQRDNAAAEVLGDLGDDLLDSVVAHVGLEEDRPHFVEERLVDEPALAFEEVADVGVQRSPELGEALL